MRTDQENRLTYKYAGLREHSGHQSVQVKIVRTLDDGLGDPGLGGRGVGDHDVYVLVHGGPAAGAADELGPDPEARGPFDKGVDVLGQPAVFQVGRPRAGMLDEQPVAGPDRRAGVDGQAAGMAAGGVRAPLTALPGTFAVVTHSPIQS
nr:hypothetical protein GCM10020093_040340 [Planobispora longispora]